MGTHTLPLRTLIPAPQPVVSCLHPSPGEAELVLFPLLHAALTLFASLTRAQRTQKGESAPQKARTSREGRRQKLSPVWASGAARPQCALAWVCLAGAGRAMAGLKSQAP